MTRTTRKAPRPHEGVHSHLSAQHPETVLQVALSTPADRAGLCWRAASQPMEPTPRSVLGVKLPSSVRDGFWGSPDTSLPPRAFKLLPTPQPSPAQCPSDELPHLHFPRQQKPEVGLLTPAPTCQFTKKHRNLSSFPSVPVSKDHGPPPASSQFLHLGSRSHCLPFLRDLAFLLLLHTESFLNALLNSGFDTHYSRHPPPPP